MPTWANRLGLLTVFVLVMSLTAVHSLSHPARAQASSSGIGIPLPPGLSDACDLIPDATARKICKAAADPIGTTGAAIGSIPGIPDPTDVIGSAVSAAGNAIIKPLLFSITSAEADAVGQALKAEAKAVNATTQTNLTADWYRKQYEVVFGMAVIIGLMMFFTRLGSAAYRQDAAGVGAGSAHFLGFLIGGALLPGIVGTAVQFLDNQVAPAFMNNAGASATQILDRLPNDINHNLTTVNSLGALLLPLIVLFFGVVGWVLLELMFFFREGMLYLVTASTVVLWGLYVSGRQAGSAVFNNSILLLITLMFFKVIAAFILVISLGLFGSQEGIQPVILGTVMLLMLPFLLWMTYQARHNIRFVPLDSMRGQITRQLVRVFAK
jgi:hypothetical protein